MKTVSISKKAIAVAGTLLFAAVVFFASLIPSHQAQAADLLPLPTITVSVPILQPVTVTPPAIVRTVTKAVTNVRTVTRTQVVTQRQTVTQRLTLPRSTQTVTLPGRVVTQPAQTVTVNAPATPQAVKTITVTQAAGQIGQRTVTLPPVTLTSRTMSTTTVAGKHKVINTTTTVTKEKPVVITRVQAVLSAFALAIIGAIAGMLVLGAYRLGWFRGDAGNRDFIEETVDDLKYNR